MSKTNQDANDSSTTSILDAINAPYELTAAQRAMIASVAAIKDPPGVRFLNAEERERCRRMNRLAPVPATTDLDRAYHNIFWGPR